MSDSLMRKCDYCSKEYHHCSNCQKEEDDLPKYHGCCCWDCYWKKMKMMEPDTYKTFFNFIGSLTKEQRSMLENITFWADDPSNIRELLKHVNYEEDFTEEMS